MTTIDVQSSKKRHRKDRKDSDDRKRSDRDIGTGNGEEKRKKRKERKEERVGDIDGALSFSLALQRADWMRIQLYM